jgi:putative oxidoreductase
MVMAIALAHWPKVFASDNGFEFPLVLLATAVAIALTGPGAYSLDTVLGVTVPVALIGIAAMLAALSILVALVSRTVPASTTQAAE